MKKLYLGTVLVLVFLGAWLADWNIRHAAPEPSASTLIRSRDDDLLEIEIGYPEGRAPLQSPPPATGKERAKPVDAGGPVPGKHGGEGPAASPVPGFRIYEVRKGDTVSEIAERLLGTSRRAGEIIRLNGLEDPKRIRPGMKLKIPAK